MLMAFKRQGPAKPTALLANHLWGIGTIRIPTGNTPVSAWFSRRLGDPQVWARIADPIQRRPSSEVRVVLTSTRGDRHPQPPIRRCALISVQDVLESPGRLAISPRVLAARVFPSNLQRRQPIDHSEDFGIVWLRNETFEFRGDKHRRLLEQLFEAYWSGSAVLRVSAVLSEAGFSDKTNSLSKAFSGQDDWQRFIRHSEGNCWIKVSGACS